MAPHPAGELAAASDELAGWEPILDDAADAS